MRHYTSAPNLATKFQYGEIFEWNHVAPVMEGAKEAGSSTPPSKSFTERVVDPAPVLTWEVPVAANPNQNSQLLNHFGIMIFDETDTLVFDSGVLDSGNAVGEVFVIGNVATYIPRLSDWQSHVTSLVATTPRTFRWIVYGGYFVEGPELPSGNRPVLLDTGAYWSSHGEIIVTP